MPHYVVSSEGPIAVREVHRPSLPEGWEPPEVGGGPIIPERPSFPERPGHGLPPYLPPREEWPELPPGFKPPEGWERPDWKPEHPWVPGDGGEPGEPEPPSIWPPLRPDRPGLPDMTGKTWVLGLLYVSRYAPVYRWVLIDHDEAKSKLTRFVEWVKSKLPAGGIVGRPPQRPGPAQ